MRCIRRTGFLKTLVSIFRGPLCPGSLNKCNFEFTSCGVGFCGLPRGLSSVGGRAVNADVRAVEQKKIVGNILLFASALDKL